ncbi:uncharacterized protein SPPG_00928 [Spizellomyces punctatus DAOM BR117]|uniref:Uncharacterized protein n=1 Tax=Spizellomyces punctatus (strain DAOM BR117) TaxID=645134 RepID=A0A0L0HR76_SPIPD|nr:uncharacterized protein SPPG_00928 [Spizellomyces punctatus DAOM BR117]KND03445.1 hypothetical protein SPPG_00928 [Spizellomyces punctatus DAOM BR117]|eukprot:XP_016611484.1 hypothetical protein SPPG_00928 [Spizellomyces punctatus DAOM BR117]
MPRVKTQPKRHIPNAKRPKQPLGLTPQQRLALDKKAGVSFVTGKVKPPKFDPADLFHHPPQRKDIIPPTIRLAKPQPPPSLSKEPLGSSKDLKPITPQSPVWAVQANPTPTYESDTSRSSCDEDGWWDVTVDSTSSDSDSDDNSDDEQV